MRVEPSHEGRVDYGPCFLLVPSSNGSPLLLLYTLAGRRVRLEVEVKVDVVHYGRGDVGNKDGGGLPGARHLLFGWDLAGVCA